MERVNSLFAVLFVVFLCSLVSGILGDCKMENGKTGTKWCRDAYNQEWDNHKNNLLHAKHTSCCLSFNMANCVQHSFEKADCGGSNKNMEVLVTEEVENAQKEVSKLISSLGSFVCGDDLNESKCRNLAAEFNKAEAKINALNGASTLTMTITPFLAIACSLLMLFYS